MKGNRTKVKYKPRANWDGWILLLALIPICAGGILVVRWALGHKGEAASILDQPVTMGTVLFFGICILLVRLFLKANK